MIRLPEEPGSAQKLFENKFFNEVKQRMPHLPSKEIASLLLSKWKHGISDEERKEFETLAEQGRKQHFVNVEQARLHENELRSRIYELQFGN